VFKAWPTIWGVLPQLLPRPALPRQPVRRSANYQKVFSDPDLRSAVVHTVIDAVCANRRIDPRRVRAGAAAPGAGAASQDPADGRVPAGRDRDGRAAELWKTILYPSGYGLANSVIGHVGVAPLPFFSSTTPRWPRSSACRSGSTPVRHGHLRRRPGRIDQQLYEAAHLDGATAWQAAQSS